MNNELTVSKSIEIRSTAKDVWVALTDPEKIKVYLFGTETVTDWKVGSPIVFQGAYEGQQYKDKGNVLENKLYEQLRYSYWSGFSGLEDNPGNYSIITYEIKELSGDRVVLTWRQKGFANEQGQQHAEQGLYGMLEQIKQLVEK